MHAASTALPEKKKMHRPMSSYGKTETCRCCRSRLSVPSHARAIRCAVCGAVTQLRAQDGRHHLPSKPGRSWMKGFLSLISSNLTPGSPPPGYIYTGTAPPSMARPPMYGLVSGKKRALLVGVSYKGRKYELKGTVNDVQCMKYFLLKNGFPQESILVLTEEERDHRRIPTRKNMVNAMQWLVNGCKKGDALLFHFSGHGSQQVDTDGDEVDGYDETLCPMDYEANGMLVDDDLNQLLVRPLSDGVKLHAVIDSCHSATVLDLPYLCRINSMGYQWEDHSTRRGIFKGTSGGLAISFSGCDDHQTSADTTALAGDAVTGAMTFCFIQALESEPAMTYGRLLTAMRYAIRNADTGLCLNGPLAVLFKRVFQTGLTQEPQLCSSEIFDVYRKPFIL